MSLFKRVGAGRAFTGTPQGAQGFVPTGWSSSDEAAHPDTRFLFEVQDDITAKLAKIGRQLRSAHAAADL